MRLKKNIKTKNMAPAAFVAAMCVVLGGTALASADPLASYGTLNAVQSSVAMIHETADTTSPIIGKAYNNTVLAVMETETINGEEWCKVTDSRGYGYVLADTLTEVENIETFESEPVVYLMDGTVLKVDPDPNSANIFAMHNTSYPYTVLETAVAPDGVEYVKIRSEYGLTGWAPRGSEGTLGFLEIDTKYDRPIWMADQMDISERATTIQGTIVEVEGLYLQYAESGDWAAAYSAIEYGWELANEASYLYDQIELSEMSDYYENEAVTLRAKTDEAYEKKVAQEAERIAAQAAQAAAEAEAARIAAEKAAAEAAKAEAAAKAVAEQTTATKIVETAKSWVGRCNYVFGGTNLSVGGGVDCSGFVQNIYRAYGFELPRNSFYQSTYVTPISVNELRPGDLCFYSANRDGQELAIGHVAIYIGNGQIVHARSESTGIMIDDVNFSNRLVKCGRVPGLN